MLQQVDSGSLITFEGSEELGLLQETIAAAGPSSLGKVLGMVEAGSWRLQMDFRGWLTNVYTAADLIDWVGDDVDRARFVASMSGIGEGAVVGVRRLAQAAAGGVVQAADRVGGGPGKGRHRPEVSHGSLPLLRFPGPPLPVSRGPPARRRRRAGRGRRS